MNAKVEKPEFRFDLIKWVLVFALLIAGIVASFIYAHQPLVFHVVGWLILLSVVSLVAFQTETGRNTWEFLQESRVEMRKVVWPNRKETIQTTLVVIVMVTITSLFLWGVDSLLLWVIGFLTGTRG